MKVSPDHRSQVAILPGRRAPERGADALADDARGTRMKRFALILAAMALGPSAFAAGIDSRAYTCPALQALVVANRFVFINNPNFDDFVVADHSYCSFSQIIQRRTVPTTDTPECIVNYCKQPSEGRGGGG